MDLLAVAPITKGGVMGKSWNLSDLMSKGGMAIRAFDLAIGYMLLMQDLRGILGAYYYRFIMTLETLPFRDVGVTLNNIEMALLTSHPSRNVLAMIEAPTLDLNVSFGLDVTGGTSTYGARNAFLFPFGASFKIVTDKTVGLVNGEVHSLDNLGVAGGASQFHPPSELPQMFSVGEGHVLVNHIPLEVLDLMAPLLETTRIVDLCVRHARFFPRDEIGQRYLTIHPLSPQMVEKPRLIMTFRTRHTAMAGGLPRFHISIHLVTEAAKCGCF
jgi:hypothetical protein